MNTLKTGKGILNRMRRIQACNVAYRRARFGRGWAWEITNGDYRIRDEFPELIPELIAFRQETAPKTIDDLTPIYP